MENIDNAAMPLTGAQKLLLETYRSGQIPEAAWREHLAEDEALRQFVEQPKDSPVSTSDFLERCRNLTDHGYGEGHQEDDIFRTIEACVNAARNATPSSNVGRIESEIASVVQSVNEWDDRTSPDDYPEHLLITSEELAGILRNFAASIAIANPEKI